MGGGGEQPVKLILKESSFIFRVGVGGVDRWVIESYGCSRVLECANVKKQVVWCDILLYLLLVPMSCGFVNMLL